MFWESKEKKILKAKLFSEIADKWAKDVYNESNNKKLNKPSQIRKFYDEVLRFKDDLQTNEKEFESVLPYIQMLKAKVNYAVGRDLVSEKFKEFIEKSVDAVKDKEDFEAFSGLFEAFMGYYKYYNGKETTH